MLDKYNLFGITDMNLSKNGNLYNRNKRTLDIKALT